VHEKLISEKASQIQANVDAYENFLFHPETKELMTVPDYCNRVMGLGKEAGSYMDVADLRDNQLITTSYLQITQKSKPYAMPFA